MSPRTIFLLLAASLFTTPLAQAVILAGGDGTQNSSAPTTDDFGWASVGLVYDTTDGINISGVYLGDGWMLSAYHGVRDGSGTGFLFGAVTFGASSYGVNAATATRLHNADLSVADLALFQLDSAPVGIPAVTLASADPTGGLALTMMGNGPTRDTAQTHWNVNTSVNPWTWAETGGAGNAQGYKWTPGQQSLHWGTNNISAFGGGATTVIDDGFGNNTVFRTNFSNLTNEAQAGGGDSGGGVFWKENGSWVLGGILQFTATYSGQPDGTSVFGDETYAANVNTYRSEIASIVPEPSAAVLVLAGMALLLRRRRG